MTEAFLSLLYKSQSPRIVNVSGSMGKLKVQITKLGCYQYIFFAYINIIQSKIEHHLSLQNIPNEWAKGILNDIPNLTEERMDEVMNEFLKDFKEGTLKINGWPLHFSAYTVSKAAVNAYTRSAAHKYGSPKFKINCVCPGSVQTDLTNGVGVSTAEQGAAAPVSLALLTDDAPSGQFFLWNDLSSFE